MLANLRSLRQRRWLASLLVMAYALRAFIPVGFMPAGDGAFTLQICPDGFPAELLASVGHAAHHHHETADSSPAPAHDHKSWMSGHCAFAAAASGPPLCHSAIVAIVPQAQILQTHSEIVAASTDFRFRIAQPRAPPTSLI